MELIINAVNPVPFTTAWPKAPPDQAVPTGPLGLLKITWLAFTAEACAVNAGYVKVTPPNPKLIFPPWFGAALRNNLPPLETHCSIFVLLVVRNVFKAKADPSPPSKNTNFVFATKIIFGSAVLYSAVAQLLLNTLFIASSLDP
ncbi:hypothetical protein [Cognataquiflexum rubidum]|uniref:hypothetical protein n=1 Tax=Cognataquiflexum rubidum TaxID=2922273 RepID=UPI001F1450A5|nr:hypothetical protein [Cognataquiflexum rubidum]MCH6235041.1 hypothetical protein [Cognataquiflexum rubidum]